VALFLHVLTQQRRFHEGMLMKFDIEGDARLTMSKNMA
jgi:hypothetical protein